jgi:hypothetical protein
MFSLQQNWRRGQNRFCLEARGEEGEMAQTMYAHMNKWINNKKQYLKKTNQNNSLTVKIMLRFLWMLGQVQGIKSEHL